MDMACRMGAAERLVNEVGRMHVYLEVEGQVLRLGEIVSRAVRSLNHVSSGLVPLAVLREELAIRLTTVPTEHQGRYVIHSKRVARGDREWVTTNSVLVAVEGQEWHPTQGARADLGLETQRHVVG